MTRNAGYCRESVICANDSSAIEDVLNHSGDITRGKTGTGVDINCPVLMRRSFLYFYDVS